MNMKILTLLTLLILTSCATDRAPRVKWDTQIEVRYTDNTLDTIHSTLTRPNGYLVRYRLVSEVSGFWGKEGAIPCLVMYHYAKENVACDVRSFKILNQTKTDVEVIK